MDRHKIVGEPTFDETTGDGSLPFYSLVFFCPRRESPMAVLLHIGMGLQPL
jgi:hypothetical protein